MAMNEADRADWRDLMEEAIESSRDAAAAALAGAVFARLRGDLNLDDALTLFTTARRLLYPEQAGN